MQKLAMLAFLCFTIQEFSQAGDGPFGFEAGITREKIVALLGKSNIVLDENDFLVFNTAPKPHSMFTRYGVTISPITGLVKLRAIGNPMEVNSFGEQLKQVYRDIFMALNDTYGQSSNSFDYLQSGSVWKEPEDWTMALLKKERTLGAFWTKRAFPNRITGIKLEATMLSRTKGVLFLDYEFEGFKEYATSEKERENKVF